MQSTPVHKSYADHFNLRKGNHQQFLSPLPMQPMLTCAIVRTYVHTDDQNVNQTVQIILCYLKTKGTILIIQFRVFTIGHRRFDYKHNISPHDS